MNEIACRDWNHFEELLAAFFRRAPRDRDMYMFRGHADARWRLQSTLDRLLPVLRESDSEAVERELVEQFVKSALPSLAEIYDMDDTAKRVIARHHGLPSSLIDFTMSPFVAAFFACHDTIHDSPSAPERIAIWALNRASIPADFGLDDFKIYEGADAIRFNPRAVAQQAISFRVLRSELQIDSFFPGKATTKFTIPTTELGTIMSRLSYMNVTHTQIYGGLDGAAAYATWRVRTIHSKDPL